MRSEQSPLSPEDVSLVPEPFVLISFLFTSTTERVVPTIEQISFVAERVPFASAPSTTAIVTLAAWLDYKATPTATAEFCISHLEGY
jgi:hypothetical protein